MSQTESKIKLIFEGVERGVAAAAAKSSAAIRSLDDDNSKLSKSADAAGKGLLVVGKGMAALGAANGAIQVIGGTLGALQQLAPAALLLPGAMLAGAAAMGTFKIATAGVGDALKAGLSGDMAKFAKATKDMAPEMQNAVKAVVAFKPQIDALKKTVQEHFWDGFADGIKSAGEKYLPILNQGLGDISTSLGAIAFGGLAAAQSPIFTASIAGILSNTAKTLGNMSDVVGDAATGFVRLGAAGATYLPKLGTGIGNLAKRFSDWSVQVVQSGKFFDWVDGAIAGFKDLGGIVGNVGSILASVFTGLGGVVESPLARIRELTGQVAEFLKTASAQEGLKALGQTLQVVGQVVGQVVMTALRELAPTLVALAPVAQEVARTLGDLLISALQTLGPLIRGVADVFAAFPGSASVATVAVVGFVAAIKTIQATNAVVSLLGLGDSIFALGSKADVAGGKVGGFAGKLGLIKGALAVGAVAALAVEMDKVNAASEGGNLSGWNGELHDIVRILTGDWGHPFDDINRQLDEMSGRWKAGEAPVQQWARAVGQAAADAALAVQNFLRGLVGLPPLPPIPLGVNTDPAKVGVDDWVGGVSRTRATANLDANPAGANAQLGGWVGHAVATVGRATLDANPAPAYGQADGWVGGVSSRRGVAQLDANPGAANGQVNAWVGNANRANGRATLDAWRGPADAVAQGFVNSWAGKVITMYINVIRSVFGATGGAVTDGVIVPGFAPGGPVRGAGTGTSDSVPAMLSDGEWVMTAEQVRKAGGFGGMQAIASALNSNGDSPMHASAKAAMRTPSASSSGSSGGGVQVSFTGNTSDALATVIMSMVRTGKIQLKAA